jgi:hypothetical protein
MTSQLAGFQIDRRLPVGSPDDYILLLRNNQNQLRLAGWTAGKAHAATVPCHVGHRKKATVTLVDGHGAESPLTIENGVLTLPLGELPVYLNPGKLRLVIPEN